MGTPTNDTFRLLDSKPIREKMDSSNPDVTFLAAIVSQHVFEDVVRAGYTTDLHPDRLEHVIAEVEEKEFAQPAWIYVPRPSHQESSGPRADADQTLTPKGAPEPAGTTIYGNVGNSISGGAFFRGVKQTRGQSS
jgi:hypothetical protein